MACTALSFPSLITNLDGFIYICEYRYIFLEKVFFFRFSIQITCGDPKKTPTFSMIHVCLQLCLETCQSHSFTDMCYAAFVSP